MKWEMETAEKDCGFASTKRINALRSSHTNCSTYMAGIILAFLNDTSVGHM